MEPHFADMFYGEQKIMNNIIPLKDVNPEAFEHMLNFMYGYQPDLKTPKKAHELFKVATRFQVTSLTTFCSFFLNNIKVEIDNVFDILEASEYLLNKDLTDRCQTLIQRETKSIISHYDCSDISPSMIRVILDSPELSLDSEYDLLVWIFAWGKNRYIENSQYSNMREALTEYLPRLHFVALTNIEFAMLNRMHDNFFSKDEIVGISMNIAIRNSWPLPDWHDSNAKFRKYTGKSEGNESEQACSMRVVAPTRPVVVVVPTQPVAVVVPTQPVAAPTRPVVAPTQPVAAPTRPVVAPTQSVAAPTRPVAAPTRPVVSPTRPVAAPTRPVVAPTRPVVAPTRPVVAPTRPVAAPTRPVVTPTQPVAAPITMCTGATTRKSRYFYDEDA